LPKSGVWISEQAKFVKTFRIQPVSKFIVMLLRLLGTNLNHFVILSHIDLPKRS